MPRIPRVPKPKGKKSFASTEPTTGDEFLAAGVTHEEAAEKWRAGDAAKSVRFYQRAIAVYEKGLSMLESLDAGRFDLEYNRARVLYTITQYPLLQKEYSQESTSALLGAALAAHQRASETAKAAYVHAQAQAKEDELESAEAAYADVLFNEAQVLCSLVEAAKDEEVGNESQRFSMATEAAKIFGMCFELQVHRLERWKGMLAQAQTDQQIGTSPVPVKTEVLDEKQEETAQEDESMDDSEDGNDGGWASVMETPTAKTVIETWIEQVRAFALVYETSPTEPSRQPSIKAPTLKNIEVYLTEFLQIAPARDNPSVAEWTRDGLPTCVEMTIVMMKMQMAMRGELCYRSKQISAQDYAQVAQSLVQSIPWDEMLDESHAWVTRAIDASPERLCSFAEILTDCNAQIAEEEPEGTTDVRWKLLTQALDVLGSASKTPGIDKGLLARIHQGRGDAELERLSAIKPSMDVRKTKRTLLNNASVYYKGAAAIARSTILASFSATNHPNEEVYRSSSIREAVAIALGAGNNENLKLLSAQFNEDDLQQELNRMVDEDLVRLDWLRSIGLKV